MINTLKWLILLGLSMLFISCTSESQEDIDERLILEYLEDNAIQAVRTESGLYYKITGEGTGDPPELNDYVTVHYEGKLLDGTVFDSSYGGTAVTFGLWEVIYGWQEGLQLMHTGEEALFIIPSHLGYGSSVVSGIPPNSVLVFNVELLEIN
ncbi:MAG: peptidylprolyl isomerase [Bacteroidia bacterium]|nr:FKBP-type peptidyl-prolyl cis-trans isomerase [Bacteroidales bacterium]NCD41845.1 peptidylprolyl isomerase [Bacteroidia bacterium]MDD2322658.1 FKBP-type peptidyl-prolyl cis-trans isomerase [Bacteroidales bacterium]MDD3010741.1 FKBP-type peptidyl-prolyl cis-trans isomerase [Bacteroidales bacterium]MDD3961807.1 FKBP-type peptidyl-prolyl cis-trans isomerase [Bacteroidales bacterium]